MMLAILAESALRSLVLGGAVWVTLHLLRVRNPHVHMTCWVMVLVASLSMPLLMHWTTVTVTLDALPVPAPQAPWSAAGPLLEPLHASPPVEPVAVPGATHAAVNWLAVATAVYALVAGILLLRLAVGISLTWRLVRAAGPVIEPWTGGWRVRVSNCIAGPVTFGSTILLPPQFSDWDTLKRRAVLAHEGAHVANRDFYILLLASLNRALFWFSPLAWWQHTRLAELAEIISDACALEVVEDRLGYAEILLDLVQRDRRALAGLEMARACTVRARVERILAATAAPSKPSRRKRIWTAAAVVPLVVVSAGSITYSRPQNVPQAIAAMTGPRPLHASFYSMGRASIFAIFREGDDLFGQLSGQRKLRLTATDDGTWSYPVTTGQITLAVDRDLQPAELTMRQNGRDIRAARIAEMSPGSVGVDAKLLDSYVGWYGLTPSRALAVTRTGDRMYVQETGRPTVEVTAQGTDAFSSDHNDLIIFLRDGQAKVTQLLLQEPAAGAQLAPRITHAKARMIEEEFARRIADVPDRFREQTPVPGSKEAILRGIADLQRGAPNYDRMSATLAAKVRRQASELHAMIKAFGAVETIFFRGVGPGGYDIYGAKFANGFAEFRILLGKDGRADDVLFRPDGNDTPGGMVACADEPGLRSLGEAVPIKLNLHNDSGSDIQLYRLDAEGKRTADVMIGENISSSIVTYVGSPWVIADTSGKCLEIVLPGQRTRQHTVGRAERLAGTRTAPQAGSDDMLRRYIEGLRRGEPDYDHMTSEVAAQTRQQLPFNRAIVARLGELRSMSFRAVSAAGSDVYIAHFANGTAEWRIGLAREGTIARIALGPQY